MGRDGTGRKGDGDAGFRFRYEVGGGGGSIRDSIRRCINATLSLLSLSFLGFPGLIEAARRAGERDETRKGRASGARAVRAQLLPLGPGRLLLVVRNDLPGPVAAARDGDGLCE
jgi:hypothetical protein